MPKTPVCVIATALLVSCSVEAGAQSQDQAAKINKWFEENADAEKRRSKYWENVHTGPMKTPGKIQNAGNINKAGAIQIPQGWKAIKTTEQPCQTRYAISGDTLFEFDRDTLTPKAVETLNLLVPELKKQSTHPVTVEGHTDSIGTDEYNQQLSHHRALRVKNWLIDNKVFDKEALKVVAHGKRKPIAPNTNEDGSDNPQGRQLNRRVEIVVDTCVTLDKEKEDAEPAPSEKPANSTTTTEEPSSKNTGAGD